jgi:hypothetical protein
MERGAMCEAAAKPRHPRDAIQAFRVRIRVYDALGGLLIGDQPTDAYHPTDIGNGLLLLVKEFEACAVEVDAWFAAQRAAGAV